MDRKDKLFVVNEVKIAPLPSLVHFSACRFQLLLSYLYFISVLQVCEIKNCNKCIFFEAKKKKDLYMWWVESSGYVMKTPGVAVIRKAPVDHNENVCVCL